MDRFAWTDGVLSGEEQLVHQQNGVRLYDGEEKTTFDHGRLLLTTHRLIWKDYKDQKRVISLTLSLVVYTEEIPATISKSPKLVVHLNAAPSYKAPGPAQNSPHSNIRLSFKEGGTKACRDFSSHLNQQLSLKHWAQQPTAPSAGIPGSASQKRELRSGIGGIQKNLEKKHNETKQNISEAFVDLSKLMDQAKQMVALSKNISQKIKDKQGDITEDETIRFKSYLLSLGISDPVTRETHGTGNKYYTELAKQLSDMLQSPLKECGGVMTLADTYCRVNRARGMELLSPEDLVNACRLMEQMHLPIVLHVFESGVMVLQLRSHSEEQTVKETKNLVLDRGHITADELSKLIGLSVVLAKERLLATERAGSVCRDDSTEGLTYYPNRFLTEPVS